MSRPRKYETEVEAKAAKLAKQSERRAAKNSFKNDPTKRRDAAVNAKSYPFAPINDETMAVIREIMVIAGDVSDPTKNTTPLSEGRRAAAMLLEWEDANKARLPVLDEETKNCGEAPNGVRISYNFGEGYEWNRLNSFLRILGHFMERSGRNKLKAERNAAREKAIADANNITVAEVRNNHDANAKRKWQEVTQAEYHRAKGDKMLAKRNARIDQQSTESMKQADTFGRF